MDSYQYDDVLVEGWEKNATSLLGIPLHHTGEMDIYSAATRSSDDQWLPVDRVRERLQSLLFQMTINILVAAIFLYNIRVGIRTVRGRYRSVGAWCCLFSSTLGCSAGLFNVGMMLGGANCRQFVWYVLLTGTVAICSHSIAVLQQAYLALQGKRWVIAFGTVCILPQLTIGILAVRYCPITVNDFGGCVTHYSTALALCWFAAIVPINAFFSGIFSYITYLQYRKSGTLVWGRLARHGIQTMCCVILCNIGCGLCLIFQVGGNDSSAFFYADLAITSIVLTNHYANMFSATSASTNKNLSGSKRDTEVDITETVTTYHERFLQATTFQSYVR